MWWLKQYTISVTGVWTEFLQNFQIWGQRTGDGPTKTFAAQASGTFKGQQASQQRISGRLAVSAHKHALIEYAFENAQRPSLV
jgi:hypothetical protein